MVKLSSFSIYLALHYLTNFRPSPPLSSAIIIVMPLLIHSTYISTHLLPRQNIGPALHMDIQHSFIDKWENNRNKYIPINNAVWDGCRTEDYMWDRMGGDWKSPGVAMLRAPLVLSNKGSITFRHTFYHIRPPSSRSRRPALHLMSLYQSIANTRHSDGRPPLQCPHHPLDIFRSRCWCRSWRFG